MDVSEPQLPTSPLIISRKKKKTQCAEHSPEGGVCSPAQDREQATRRKTFVLIFQSVVRNKYRKIERHRRNGSHFAAQNWRYCRWPWTKPWPGSSGVIGNCRCKRAISEASNAISSGEKYIHRSHAARCALRPVAALRPVTALRPVAALWNPAPFLSW